MYISSPETDKILDIISSHDISKDQGLMLLIGEKNAPDIKTLLKELNKLNIAYFGGIFPGIIYNNSYFEEGIIFKIFPIIEKPFIIKGLENGKINIPEAIEKISNQLQDKYTAIILVDGLSRYVNRFLFEVFNRLGDSVNYFGGGAGSVSLKQQPCVFSSEGIFQDASVVTLIKKQCGLGVKHGWKRIRGPIVANKTQDNRILELNWRKAFDIYRETVELDAAVKLTTENFFEITRGYPFGIYREGCEDIVRDPIAVTPEGELICVGDIPENTVLYILKGEKDNLINAAKEAAQECKKLNIKDSTDILVADCLSRILILNQHFKDELNVINNVFQKEEPATIEGILTLGEISLYGNEYLEFFNKTIVVGCYYD